MKSVYMKTRSAANLMIKAGDLSNYITHLIGVIRDEYINFLCHELKETFFTTGNKVLADYFNDYPKEHKYLNIGNAQLNFLTLLQGSVYSTRDTFSYGVDGSFFNLDHSRKYSGLKLKQDYEGFLYEETKRKNKNDSQCDLIHYLSEYSIDTLIESLIDSGLLRVEKYQIKKQALLFIEGIERVYGPKIETYEATVEVMKARVEHNDQGITLFLMVDWNI